MSIFAQESNLRSYELKIDTKKIKLDSLSIFPGSFELYCNGVPITDYELDFASAELTLRNTCDSSLHISYRVLPFDLSKTVMRRDTSLIYSDTKGNRDAFMWSSNDPVEDIFGSSGLSKSGSISRGVTFGNSQNLGVNSTLNLELSGQIAPNLHILASLSDDNLPIQADGNTNKLKEFDQVFIQVYNDRFKMIAGDYWLYKPKGYFMNYKKRTQGLTIENKWGSDSTRMLKTQLSGAISRGKFNRLIIQGVEGNQGPYRLRGAENEPYIIILSGTEKIFIDGRLLERGQEFDYTIDYNMGEVTFTSRNQITKDSRIVIEFQYSDQNYLRSLFQSASVFESKRLKYWLNAYTEQDMKNQNLQQQLSIEQKLLLADIGDTLDAARMNSIDSIGYVDNQNLYKLVDSLGYDSVLVFSVHPDSAHYRASFEFVGSGKGNYILKEYNALGKVYQWLAPVANVPQGDYEASRLIRTPKQRQMISSGFNLKLNEHVFLETELAYSKNDLNTFSSHDSQDDQSIGAFVKFQGDIPLSRDSIPNWILRTKLSMEARERNFSPIEQYRAVEFDRDWNTRNQEYRGNELASIFSANLMNTHGNINLEGQQYLIGTDYNGYRAASDGTWKQKGFQARWDASYLASEASGKNEFLRHRIDFSKQLGWFKLGFKDDQEQNLFRENYLMNNSYSFYDYQFYLANSDSLKHNFKIFYRERYDRRSDSTKLTPIAKARSYGSEVSIADWKNQRIVLLASYRELRILDTLLSDNKPENTVVGRLEYELKAWKGALNWSTFYEVGSGLEQKREFLYLEVNTGQGIYTWLDYNGNGIKDLNEFEVAQYTDQASYIRVFTPGNDYVKTYSNEFNQTLSLRPERLWAAKGGILKLLSRFSDQARFRVSKKTGTFIASESFNPFVLNVSDSSLIAINSTIRNTVFFNRTSQVFGSEYTYQQVTSKSLLASGFDSRGNTFHEVVIRWNLSRSLTLQVGGMVGSKLSEADYTSGRNYKIAYREVKPVFAFQPGTRFRISLDPRYSFKQNALELGNEVAEFMELGLNLKYNQAEKGSFQATIKALQIRFTGTENSSLAFEMLESLKPGTNYTWQFGYQRSISKSLQLSFQYNGRQSPNNKMIHSGGMELRAFF